MEKSVQHDITNQPLMPIWSIQIEILTQKLIPPWIRNLSIICCVPALRVAKKNRQQVWPLVYKSTLITYTFEKYTTFDLVSLVLNGFKFSI
jgi:hypothetical protein